MELIEFNENAEGLTLPEFFAMCKLLGSSMEDYVIYIPRYFNIPRKIIVIQEENCGNCINLQIQHWADPQAGIYTFHLINNCIHKESSVFTLNVNSGINGKLKVLLYG